MRHLADATFGAYGTWRARHYDPNRTILVASSGRGGSTWLADIIATLPWHHTLQEPFHLGNNPECRDYGFTWQNYIPRGTEAEPKRRYLESLLAGERLSTGIIFRFNFDPLRLLFVRGYVVKCINANMMLPWMLDVCPVRAVFMVRHPCAVVGSQLAHGAWGKVTKKTTTIPEGLFEDYPEFEEVFESIHTREEVLAFEWAIQTRIPLSEPLPHPWHFTTYEWMVTQGPQELERLFAYLGEPVPEAAYERLRTASATTDANSHVATGKDRLTGWKHRLTPAQIDAVLSVTHRMGVDFYTDDLLPDIGKLPIERVSSEE